MVDGQWSEWSPWDECPVTCGGFNINRTRTCDNPRPTYNGLECPESNAETIPCAENPCPVNGSWTDWGAWSECTRPCNNGTQQRTRTCSDPATAHGGYDCYGNQSEEIAAEEETVICNDIPCPIHGGHSQWTEWPECPVSCGGASITRNRSCDNPEPKHGGNECAAPSSESQICNGEIQCPINGYWGRWLDWSPCSKSCRGGIQTRIRLCNNPSALYGGRPCEGSWELSLSCNHFSCPVDGGFSQWTAWLTCSKTCGGGQTSRTRDCTAPAPQHGGNPCYGPTIERKLCAAFYCPVHGDWSAWSPWSLCAVTCGGAIVNRTRTCTDPAPRHEGRPCEGPVDDWTSCANDSCPIDGYWSSWNAWSYCSTFCGEGVITTSRLCDDPPAQFGGHPCLGEGDRQVYCSLVEYCPDEVPVVVNLTTVVQVSDVSLTLVLQWDVTPAESQVDYLIVEVKSLLPRPNATEDWEHYAFLPGDSVYFPLRDIDQMGLFTSSLGIRVIVRADSGESLSEEKFLNVAEYIPKIGSSFQHWSPSPGWCFLGLLLSWGRLISE